MPRFQPIQIDHAQGRIADDAGFDDADVLEVGAASYNTFTNHIHHAEQTDVDVPVARRHDATAA